MNAIRHIVFLWGISWIACFGLDAAAAEKPNVLFIAVDKWKLPSDASRAIGIMIRDQEYLVYAPAVTRVVSGDYSDLSEVVAPTDIQDSGELFLRSLQSRYTDSVLAGFLFCSVDLEVVRYPFYLKKKPKR